MTDEEIVRQVKKAETGILFKKGSYGYHRTQLKLEVENENIKGEAHKISSIDKKG